MKFSFKQEEKKIEKSNFDMTLEALESSEKYMTKMVGEMVVAAGGITLDTMLDPISKIALDNTMEYYQLAREQILDNARRMDQKEADLNEKLDKQSKLLEEVLKKIK